MIKIETIKDPGPFEVCDACRKVAEWRVTAAPDARKDISEKIFLCSSCYSDLKWAARELYEATMGTCISDGVLEIQPVGDAQPKTGGGPR